MQVEHLRYLLDIYNLRSISAAAHYLHIAQTTLSAIIKSVEDELGFSVFKRMPTGVAPTEKGQAVLNLAWEVTVRYESLMSLRDRSDEPPQFFNLLVSPVLPAFILTSITERFSQFHSFGNICFEEYPSKNIAAAIAGRMAGIGFALLSKRQFIQIQHSYTSQYVTIELLYEDNLSCIVPADSLAATQGSIMLKDLKDTHVVLPYAPMDQESFLTSLSRYLPNFSILPDISLLLAGVARHEFISILPHKTIEQDIFIRNGECRIIPILDPEYDFSICACLCSRPFNRLNRQEQFAYHCIKNFCAELLSPASQNSSEVTNYKKSREN